MNETHCNVCLAEDSNSTGAQCGWEFPCEQTWAMANDTICLDYDQCYAYSEHSESGSSSIDSSDENQEVETGEFVFGYNIEEEQSEEKHVFSMEDQNNNIVMAGILSMNRDITSFIQQLFAQFNIDNKWAHYFSSDDGFLAVGDGVDELLQLLELDNEDFAWIPYYENVSESTAMYHLYLDQLSVDNEEDTKIIFEGDANWNQSLNVLTFDTFVTGISLNEEWQDDILEFIADTSEIELIDNGYYPYCINTTHDDLVDDIFNGLPDIRISLTGNMEYIISAEQYVVAIDNDSIEYNFCLDISFDCDDGVCLGSAALSDYVIIYNDDTKFVGIYDNNQHHEREENTQNTQDLLEFTEQSTKYIFALSIALAAALICLLLISGICVFLLRRMSRKKEDDSMYGRNKWNSMRRNSVRLENSMSPDHVDVNEKVSHKLELDPSGSNSKNKSMSFSSSLSPLHYYDGNIKSIVYDRIIQPWTLEDNIDAI